MQVSVYIMGKEGVQLIKTSELREYDFEGNKDGLALLRKAGDKNE